ncbi:hypothetical protein PAXRUDRAFT_12308 [Paxillus rubicundulus Ve08.2h10]|uniref:Uncharacterized protein n=1 Tax=Paxillus rubicundulus Ve08.2h10 TaxID=930991 RepID=A0A0D0DPR9_9AGAM|nr:hypothetical protein PAXRUDRAFT_12308 [Paxillus rubicundulus Ve08.2h10]
MLFSEDKSAPRPEGQASGRTKLEIRAVIAELVFKDDQDYALLFALHAAKFAKAVQDCLGILKKGYREQAVKFTQTGNGIAPDTEGHISGGASPHTPQSPKALINSVPGASRGAQLLALVQKQNSSNTATSSDPSIVNHSAAATPDVQATTAPSPTPPSDPPVVPQAATGALASPIARLPPAGHQDKGKAHAADTPFEDEMFEPSQDFDMDGGNFGGLDCPAEGDTDMDSGYARGHKCISMISFSPFPYCLRISKKESYT